MTTAQHRTRGVPARAVADLAALERLVAHALAGATARVADVEGTFDLADRTEAAMSRAVRLRDVALARVRRDPDALVADAALVDTLAILDPPLGEPGTDQSPDPRATLATVVAPLALDRYRRARDAADDLYDARLLPALDDGLATWGRLAVHEADGPAGGSGSVVPLDGIGWAPRDRVPVPARPAGGTPLEPGAPLELYETSRAEPANVRHTLHEAVLAETGALELMARTSYEHPELPWSFHLAAARHAADEARHARIFHRLLLERGGSIGADGPVHTTLYSALYQFPPCEPGSARELAWRLLLLGTVLEGLAIDQFAFEEQQWAALGEPELAEATGRVLDDELFHAGSNLRWSAEVCASNQMDPAFERELAHAFFLEAQDRARQAYLAADPERAEREAALLERPDPDATGLHSRLEVELRRRAGFSDAELDQARRWAYHPGDEPFRNPSGRPGDAPTAAPAGTPTPPGSRRLGGLRP